MAEQEPEVDSRSTRESANRISNLNTFRFSGEKFEFTQIYNLLKFCLMVSCVVSYLLVLHADVRSEHYESFFVQAGVSAALFPSVFRVTMMLMQLEQSSFIDWTVLLFITAHLAGACFVLFLIIVEQGLETLQVSMVSAATSISLSLCICAAEIVGMVLVGTSSIRQRSSTVTPDDSVLDVKDQVTPVL